MSFFPEHRKRNGRAAADVPRSQNASRPEPDTSAPQDSRPDADAIVHRTENFVIRPARYRLEDVILSDVTRQRIDALIAKIEHHRTLYEAWDLAAVDLGGRRVAVNLFGPPGTGKTMCAEGIAYRLGRPILTVSYAELESKYVGETPKNIVAAFAAARREGAVLFFDEADSILGRRMTNVTQSADHGVNVSRSTMLLQLDSFEGVVVFATNLARNYDGAFVRRILGHVEIPLPDMACRVQIAERFLRPKLPRAEDVTTSWVAEITDGLSGGELLHIVVNAATRAVQRSGPRQAIDRGDIEAEVEALRTARTAVGLDPGRAVVTEEVLEPAAAARELEPEPT